jgi:hypothetical protein
MGSMKIITKHLTGITAACIMLFASANLAHASERCTNETFKGLYGVELTGVAGGAFQTTFVFSFVADGRGGIPSGNGTQGFPGLIVNNITLLGSYFVNADCSGQLKVTSNDGDVGIENFVLLDGGNKFVLIDDIPGDVLTGEGERISVNPDTHCSANQVRGTYSLSESGLQSGNSPFGFVAKFQADGRGNVTNGSGTVANGHVVINNLTFTATYTVNADCSGTLAMANVSPAFQAKTFNFVVLEDGQKLLLIDTITNNIETAVAQRLKGGDQD